MNLNWRKIILIIVCAECLFVYWNGLGTMSLKKQQTTTIAPVTQQKVPLTQLQPAIPRHTIESDQPTANQKTSSS